MSQVIQNDGLFIQKSTDVPHEDKKVISYEQPTEQLILERNAELRKDNGAALKDLSFGRQLASIPMIQYMALLKKYPKLSSPDARESSAEMMRILQLPEHRHLLVRSKI